ncbi:non-specific serine/threonine protein kinase [Inhella inkyongensis]|uniref:non-specific serine/threonine protein kinase n=1 Tax=Inhella inkyongensis TaxID=392593 RepID=A0A840S7H4_9BURK|nr:serine/threonine-protein kinase [Inhella inkyongensis]MBB5205458.1 non-specific serine/threonine protein kinase [Inhella inkyongensis]
MSDTVPPLIDEPNALPAGTRFGELEILRVLGVGGFGIVYLAMDHALERQVAIKEYMPSQLAQRQQSTTVVVRSSQVVETFELGLRSFVNEARMLARFDHPSLLKVYRFWEANGTAYMVMPYLQGKTLKQVREASGDAPGEAWIMKRVLPLIEALELLHAEQVFHRDIAPDNILLPSDGADPILLDFGAARRVIGDRTQSLTAIFKPSYAPIEQYGETTQLRQGAWTDVYSLGAVLHYLLVGTPPPLATTRAVVDEMVPLAQRRDWPMHSRHFRAAIDWALSVRPSMRPQSMAEMRDALMGDRTLPVVRPNLPPPADKGSSVAAALPSAAPAPMAADQGYEFTQILPAAAVMDQAVTQPLHQAPPVAAVQSPASASAPKPAPQPAAAAPAPQTAKSGPLSVAGALPSQDHKEVAKGLPKAWWWGAGALGLVLLTSFWWVLVSRPAGPPGAESADLTHADAASAPSSAAVTAASTPATQTSAVPVVPPTVQTGKAGAVAGLESTGKSPASAITAPKSVASAEPAASRPPAARLPRLAKPEPAVAQPAVQAEPETAVGHEDPRAACGDRVFIALWRCIERNCEEPRYREHAECVTLRERRERRERR